ncbi:MAG TPA: hypothetical protein VG126_00590 [Thermoleophilaceae bacterium]|nr:hypothetical protein [Thermoleophilaceae bacterium]
MGIDHPERAPANIGEPFGQAAPTGQSNQRGAFAPVREERAGSRDGIASGGERAGEHAAVRMQGPIAADPGYGPEGNPR